MPFWRWWRRTPDIARMQARRDRAGLIRALCGAEETAVRRAAAEALGAIGGPEAAKALQSARQDPAPDVRAAVVRALGEIGGGAAMSALGPALLDPAPEVRKTAGELLVRQGEPGVSVLAAALRDARPTLRLEIVGLLGRITGAAANEALFPLLDDPDPAIRHGALEALAARDALPAGWLIPHLKDPDPALRRQAAALLAAVGLPEEPAVRMDYARATGDWEPLAALGAAAIPLLKAALGDKALSRAVAHQLARLGGAALDPLLEALSQRNLELRQNAAAALEAVRDPRIVDTMIAALEDPDWMVCQSAVRALTVQGDRRAIPPLIALLESEALGVSAEAAKALSWLGWEPGADADSAAYWIARRLSGECLKIGAPAVGPLLRALTRGDRDSRVAVADTLRQLHRSGVLDPQSRAQIEAAQGTLMVAGWGREERDDNGYPVIVSIPDLRFELE